MPSFLLDNGLSTQHAPNLTAHLPPTPSPENGTPHSPGHPNQQPKFTHHPGPVDSLVTTHPFLSTPTVTTLFPGLSTSHGTSHIPPTSLQASFLHPTSAEPLEYPSRTGSSSHMISQLAPLSGSPWTIGNHLQTHPALGPHLLFMSSYTENLFVPKHSLISHSSVSAHPAPSPRPSQQIHGRDLSLSQASMQEKGLGLSQENTSWHNRTYQECTLLQGKGPTLHGFIFSSSVPSCWTFGLFQV